MSIGRARSGAAAALLFVLALGCVVTARIGGSPESASDPTARLRALVPAAARCDRRARHGALRCRVDGIAVEYRPAPIAGRSRGAGRTWSRPGDPGRAAGRFGSEMVHGVATMWWTVADEGIFARAVAPRGDLASLFAWWSTHAERRPPDLP